MNPYYDYEKLGLDMLSFGEPDLSYEFNTLCFWATTLGAVYSASDSGCSCPTPFEKYEGSTLPEITQQLERVGSSDQAARIFDSWLETFQSMNRLPATSRIELTTWIEAKLGKPSTSQ